MVHADAGVFLVDQKTLFERLFATEALLARFEQSLSRSSGKGVDRLNGFQYAARSKAEFPIASTKCLSGEYVFSPYLEVLQQKGRGQTPRIISIPVIRDRVVLGQLNEFLSAVFPDCVPRRLANTYISKIT